MHAFACLQIVPSLNEMTCDISGNRTNLYNDPWATQSIPYKSWQYTYHTYSTIMPWHAGYNITIHQCSVPLFNYQVDGEILKSLLSWCSITICKILDTWIGVILTWYHNMLIPWDWDVCQSMLMCIPSTRWHVSTIVTHTAYSTYP